MIFLGNLTVINPTKSQVGLVHNMPMDSEYGMGMTEDQLNQIGILVDSIPEPTPPQGQNAIMYVDPTTKTITYEYVTPPPTIEEQLAQIQQAQKTPDDLYKELDLTTAALADVQSAKIDQLHYLYGQTLASGFQAVLSDGNTYTFAWTTDDKANLMATQDAIDGQFIAFPINYADVNGHPVPLASQADLTTIKAKATSFFGNQHQQVLTLVGQAKTATDNQSVDKIVWAPATY